MQVRTFVHLYMAPGPGQADATPYIEESEFNVTDSYVVSWSLAEDESWKGCESSLTFHVY